MRKISKKKLDKSKEKRGSGRNCWNVIIKYNFSDGWKVES